MMESFFVYTETEAVVHSKHNVRSNSSEGWTSKEGNEGTFGGSIDRLKAEEKQRHKAMRQDSYLAAVKPVPAISGTALNCAFGS